MYHYVFANREENQEIALSLSPGEFMQGILVMIRMLGFEPNTAPVIVYAREEHDNAWFPIYGANDNEPVLFPLLSVDAVKKLSEEDYHMLGRKALEAYTAIRENWLKIQSSGRKHEKPVQKMLDDLQSKMLEIESVVTGTEYEDLFDTKFKLRQKDVSSAFQLHVGLRTIGRRVDEMAVHIGQVLHISTTARKLQELLEWADRSKPRGKLRAK